MPDASLATRDFSRQSGLVPAEKLAATPIIVVGVGAVGRQLALQLASIGARDVMLIDHDKVEMTNITTQGYHAEDIGRSKVLATELAMRRIDSNIKITAIDDCFRTKYVRRGALFCCVDSIDVRGVMWREVNNRVDFWTDGRMLGEIIRVITASDAASREYYPTTLFKEEEAEQGRCTARSTIYAAGITANLMIHQFTRWLRGIDNDADLMLNLLSSEMTILSEAVPA